MMEPAHTIIQICGGFAAVAEMTGRSEVRVRRWTYSKERGGTDGFIPSEVAALLLRMAQERGKPLTAQHFFPGEVDGGGADHAAGLSGEGAAT